MIKNFKKFALLFLLIISGLQFLHAQETKSIQEKYPEVFNINPYTFDLTELAQIDLEDLKQQAYFLMLQKDYENAARFYLYIVNRSMNDASACYDLARCYAYLGQAGYAANFLILAINNGFNNFTFIREDEAFNQLQKNPEFFNRYQAVLNAGKSLGENIYVKGEKLIKCRVLLPENYQPEVSYPLVIGMHGFGGTTEEFTKLWAYFEKHSFIFVMPEGPYNAYSDVSVRPIAYSWDIRVEDIDLYKRADNLSSQFIINVKKYVSEKFNVEKSYIMGFSQGGGYAYVTGIKNPEEFEGIICFGASLPDTKKYPWFLSEEDIVKGNKLKVFIANGTEDHIKNANEAKKILKKNGYEVKFQEFEGGHFVEPNAFKAALEWFGIQ